MYPLSKNSPIYSGGVPISVDRVWILVQFIRSAHWWGVFTSLTQFYNLYINFIVIITGRFTDVWQGRYQKQYQKHLLSLIFDRKTCGLTPGEINRKLTEMGYLSVRGKPPMSKHVRRMMKKNRINLKPWKSYHFYC